MYIILINMYIIILHMYTYDFDFDFAAFRVSSTQPCEFHAWVEG